MSFIAHQCSGQAERESRDTVRIQERAKQNLIKVALLFLGVRPGAPSSVLAPSSDAIG